jgi:hypothetical protein
MPCLWDSTAAELATYLSLSLRQAREQSAE